MVTIKDVAEAVGVSVTTVSRALNDYADVAPETKARIREAARALDYHPNAAARSLQNQRANAVGLVIPRTLHRPYDAFWLEFIGGMISVFVDHELDLSLATAGRPEESVPTFQRWVRSRRVDGVVICDVQRDDARIRYLQEHGVPFVAFGRATDGLQEYSYIDVDGAAGVIQGVRHLTELGHRRVAYLGVDPAFGFSYYRLAGYREALAAAGLPYDEDLVIEGLDQVSALGAVTELLNMERPPTAVFAAADFLALAALRVTREKGLRVPEDLSIVVFDDNLPVQQAHPPLTAISQPNQRLGEEAAELLLGRLRSPDRALMQRLVVPAFIERSSTARPHRTEQRERAPRPSSAGVVSKPPARKRKVRT